MNAILPLGIDDASAAGRPILQAAQASYGFTPNLLKVMANAPSLLKAYTTIAGIFEQSSLSNAERQIVLLTVSRHNGCEYCVAAHSSIADSQSVDPATIEAIREDDPISNARHEALRRMTAAIVLQRGWVEESEELEGFYAAGYQSDQLLEILVGVAMKTLSNYTNHVAHTPLDPAFAGRAWQHRRLESSAA